MVTDSKGGSGSGDGPVRARSTRQKRALAEVLAETERFRSAQELHAALAERGARIGLTTVYGQLRSLAEAGEVDVTRAGDGELLYRRCATEEHHHHVVCRVCGRTVEVAGEAVEQWARRVGTQAGFVDVTHTVEVTGVCTDCASRRRARRGG